ncbi:hypothetical protein HYPSUDRAFT_197956 [Hypholoma sublateritium FD-334 SS-4]|uniref:AAA+ ATPase domain-containing protein n=1 Tax=Hypholoma sublateritium (strain FD-334 SS-4) TaxID=945553 RepID=A0A0D2MUX9_HYPSF|nr:hypothetical protein HYPSUDRAFT_197956 [Hypholoma sublateritium FD-334 SS-4]
MDVLPSPDPSDQHTSDDSSNLPDDKSTPGDSPSDTAPAPAPSIIPQPFIDRVLWPSTGKPEAQFAAVASSDDLTTRVCASIEYAFYSAERRAKAAFAGSVALYCPVPVGNPILDSVLKLIADRTNADVLELDALELAAGSLGPDATPVEVENNAHLSRSLFSSVAPGAAERKNFEAFFTALINVPSARGTKRRIIYLRDIGSIAMSAKPFASVLLRAIQKNRQKDGVPTVLLVFGVSAKMNRAKASNGEKAKSASQKEPEDGPLLPPLEAKICGPNGLAVDNLSPLAFAADSPSADEGGLMSLQIGAEGEVDDQDAEPTKNIWPIKVRSACYSDSEDSDEYPAPPGHVPDANWIQSIYQGLAAVIQNTPVFVIEPTGAEGPDAQRLQLDILKSRVEAINRAAMRIIVQSDGARLSKEAEDLWVALARAEDNLKASTDNPHRPSTVLCLLAVRLTTSIAIGLSSAENASSDAPVLLAPHHISRAYRLSQMTCKPNTLTNCADPAEPAPPSRSVMEKSAAERIAAVSNKPDLKDKEKMFISRILKPERLQKTTFADVVIDPRVKETLRSIISLPLLHPEQFSTGILATEALSGILLYGPPGTGKTLICRALALDFGVPMLLVRPSDVMNLYVGESEKLVKALFNIAHEVAPCIVFIDEVDAIFRARASGRASGTAEAHRSMLTEFMQAMDGIQTQGTDGVVVIGATNRPFDLDAAILRRLPRRMIIDLPAPAQRKEILELYLRAETCAADLDISDIARRTEYFSGSDLKNLCVSAALEAVNEALLAPPAPAPAAPEGQGAPRALRLITQAHFTRALQLIPPSFSAEANAGLYKWHAEFAGAAQLGVGAGVPPGGDAQAGRGGSEAV